MTNNIITKREKKAAIFSLFLFLMLSASPVLAVGEPDAITNLSATDGNGQATLSWTAPNDNGSAITAYVVEYGTVTSGLFDLTCNDASCTDATPGAIVPGLTNLTEYQFRVSATNGNGTGSASNTATTTPNLCAPLAINDDSGGPTISDSCLSVQVTAGSISVENIPDSFTFSSKYSSSLPQDSFSNDNPSTTPIDVSTGTEDIITVSDLRNAGGFDVTITSTDFISPGDTIPLENLSIASTCPDGNDLAADLYGSPNNCDNANGAEFADGSSNTGNMSQINAVHSDNATGTPANATELTTLRNAYLNDGQSFDENSDLTPDIITLMESTGPRVARLSQALNFYLNIPANQTAGTYNITFTIDLIPN